MKLTRTASPVSVLPLGLVATVNVVFILLFFFLLGSSFVLQPGIAVTLPFSSFNLPPQVNARTVTLQSGDTSVRIFYQDEPVTLEQLGQRLAAYRGSPRSIILRADRGTPYESVVTVMNQALQQHYNVALATVPPPNP